MNKVGFFIAALIASGSAMATNNGNGHGHGRGHGHGHDHSRPAATVTNTNNPVNTNTVNSAGGAANATANPVATATGGAGGSATVTANPTATGGNASATGGAATATTGASTSLATSTSNGGVANGGAAQSSSGGNTQQTSFNSPRNAPAVVTAPPTVVGCGAGGSAGGSGPGGAAVFGVSFVTAECHGWTLASAYLSLGDRVAACQVLNTQKSARRAAKRGAKLPDCNNLPEIVVPVAEKVPGSVINIFNETKEGGYTREDLKEIEKRMLNSLSK